MLHAVMLAAAISATHPSSMPTTSTQRCFATMDGAVYHGDPSDRRQMKRDVATCKKSAAEMNATLPRTVGQGPEKLFIIGRILDRAATLSYIGLGDSVTALHDVKMANLYSRIAAGLPNESAVYHEAALANVALTRVQLKTLNAEPAIAARVHAHPAVTAYHKL